MTILFWILLGSYLTGSVFIYLTVKANLEIEICPEWRKHLLALGIALLWPLAMLWTLILALRERFR